MPPSRWRGFCAGVIAAALEKLPPGLTAAELEDAVRPLYPFGSRRNHPYRMWRKEVGAQIAARLALSPPPAVTLAPAGPSCALCATGCLACLEARGRWAALPEALRLEWEAVCRAASPRRGRGGDPAAMNAARDWAEEHMDLPVTSSVTKSRARREKP